MVTWAYILLFVLALPLLAARSAKALSAPNRPRPSRLALHFNTLAMLCILLGISVAVARRESIALFPAWQPGWVDLAALASFLALTVGALARRATRLEPSQRERLELITMTNWRDPRQFIPYLAVCIMAGIAEETAYRGVLTQMLERESGSQVVAIIIASLAFGAAHSVQGWTGIVLAALFGALFHIVVLITGNLYIAIIAHTAYDLIAGVTIAELAMRRAAAASASQPRGTPTD